MIRNIEDFTNIKLYDEMVLNGEEKQSKEELGAIIDEHNKNASIFNKRIKSVMLKTYDMNWNMSEKRLKNELMKNGQIKANPEKEIKLEEKFGIPFQNRKWFECTIEEMRFSTISNANNRDVQHAYVFVESTFLEIIKESVFLKSKMGARKIYFENIAGIDYDSRGKLHLSNNLIINLKSSEHIQLKNINENWSKYITDKYEQYLFNKNSNNVQSRERGNDVDDLMKYAELYEKGLLTKEEFDLMKSKLLSTNSPIAEQPNSIEEISPIEEEPKGRFCPNCGSKVDADSNFCTDCGTKL